MNQQPQNPQQFPNVDDVNQMIRTVNAMTITEAYNSPMALQRFLAVNGLGISETNHLMNREGIVSFSRLITLFPVTKEFEKFIMDVNKTFGGSSLPNRIYFNISARKSLVSVHFYITRCLLINQIPDVRLLDITSCIAYMENNLKLNSDTDDSESKIKLPEFKQAENWISFRDKFVELLACTKGSTGLSLQYVIRLEDNNQDTYVEASNPDLTDESIFDTSMILRGSHFKEDNRAVYNVLSKHLLGTHGQNYLEEFKARRDGRSAWLALRSHYEGDSYVDLYRKKAYDKLQKTFYHGERPKFDFEKYIHVHLTAHRWLEDINQPLIESTKIHFFLAGIQANSGLSTALEILSSNPNLKDNLSAIINYLSESVQKRKSSTDTPQRYNRNVSSSMRGRGRGRNPRQFGRGGGRYGGRRQNNRGRGGRSNRGRSSNSYNDRSNNRHVDGRWISGRYYSDEEFSNMTPAQRSAAIEIREQSNNTSNNNCQQYDDRTIASLGSTIATSIQEAMTRGVAQASIEEVDYQNNDSHNNQSDTSSQKRKSDNTSSAGTQFMKRSRGANNQN